MPDRIESDVPSPATTGETKVVQEGGGEPKEPQTGDEVIQQTLGQKLFDDYANLMDGERSFKLMDKDFSGGLSRTELENSKHPRAKDMLRDFDSIVTASEDTWGSETEITHNDLEQKFQKTLDETEIKTGDFDLASNGIRITARMYPDSGLNSLKLEDSQRHIEVDYRRHAQFGISRGTAGEEAKRDKSDLALHKFDVAIGSVLGQELTRAYLMDAEIRNAVFKTIDKDDNGFLSRKELKEYTAKEPTRAEDRRTHQAAKNMLTDFAVLQGSSNDELFAESRGITAKDLTQNLVRVARETNMHDRIENRLDTGLPGKRLHGPNLYECVDGETATKASLSNGYKTLEIQDPHRNQIVKIFDKAQVSISYDTYPDKK